MVVSVQAESNGVDPSAALEVAGPILVVKGQDGVGPSVRVAVGAAV
ncbi:MAG TPA: hypothetical protein VJ436_14600 [Anaerolineales bacterium]|nr:hypothetical protein [Anaerolineales bacterium]